MKNLRSFLACRDLDDAMKESVEAARLGPEEDRYLRELLRADWGDSPQAIYNLLMNAYVIPDDIRLDVLLQGLAHPHAPFRLAAVIGTQGRAEFGERRRAFVDALLALGHGKGLIAGRARTVLADWRLAIDDPGDALAAKLDALLAAYGGPLACMAAAYLPNYREVEGVDL